MSNSVCMGREVVLCGYRYWNRGDSYSWVVSHVKVLEYCSLHSIQVERCDVYLG